MSDRLTQTRRVGGKRSTRVQFESKRFDEKGEGVDVFVCLRANPSPAHPAHLHTFRERRGSRDNVCLRANLLPGHLACPCICSSGSESFRLYTLHTLISRCPGGVS